MHAKHLQLLFFHSCRCSLFRHQWFHAIPPLSWHISNIHLWDLFLILLQLFYSAGGYNAALELDQAGLSNLLCHQCRRNRSVNIQLQTNSRPHSVNTNNPGSTLLSIEICFFLHDRKDRFHNLALAKESERLT